MLATQIDITPVLKSMLDTLLTPALIRLWIPLVVMFAFVAVLRTSFVKGWLGEAMVNLGLKLRLDKNLYHRVKNVTLPCDGRTTQIDHVIVSRFGIFVIETKNMNGWIFGSERDASWTQKFPRTSHQFPNPLRQNYKHTAVLSEILGLPMGIFRPIIMFIGNAKLKTEMPPNVVTHRLVSYIKSHKMPLLTEEQVATAMATIADNRLAPGLRTHVAHVRNVKAILAEKSLQQSHSQPAQAVASPAGKSVVVTAQTAPSCPKCGRMMVSRVAKSGPRAGKNFWGCPGFPNCRTIINQD